MRVVFFLWDFGRGGAENKLCSLDHKFSIVLVLWALFHKTYFHHFLNM